MLSSRNKMCILAASSLITINASAYSDCHWFASEDILYWETCETGLMYGSKSHLQGFAASTTLTQQYNKIKNVHHRPDFGYRLGIGAHDPCGCWDIAIYWTTFTNDAHGHHDQPASFVDWFTPAFGAVAVSTGGDIVPDGQLLGGAFPTGIGASGFPVRSASAHWKLRLNLIDIELAQKHVFACGFTFRPIVGLRTALIDQRYDVKYIADTVALGTQFSFTPGQPIDKISMKSDFEGVGPRIGVNGEYSLGCGISLYGYSAASLLWGMQDIQTKEKYQLVRQLGADTSSSYYFLKQKDQEGSCRAMTDLAIGFSWNYLCCQRVLQLKFGYEQHMVFSESTFEKFTNFASTSNSGTDRYPQQTRGNLCVHGLVASTQIDF